MSLLLEHKEYIELLRKEYFSNSWEEAINCRAECISPKIEKLTFGFTTTGVKQMCVLDITNNLKKEL